MAYGLKYQNEFNSRSDETGLQHTYFLQFWFKDYTGQAISIFGGETSVIQRCTVDDPMAPIKGQSLDITLVNEGNNLPITAFQSEDDDGVQVRLLEGTNLKFIGYLVQDDFYELQVDFAHTITISANDGLGLLKGVILSDAAVRRAFNMSFRTNGVDTVVYMWTEDAAFYPQVGNTIEILGISYVIVTAINETTFIGPAEYNWTITLNTSTGGIPQTLDIIYLTGEINLLLKNSLLSIIASCLVQTDLALVTNIFLNHCEYRQNPLVSTFEQTLINSQIFISGETYDNCYSVLEKILTAFKCTLFQANGQWNIVHWPEFRRWASNAVPGFVYDETWSAIGTTMFSNTFNIGPGNPTTWQSGLQNGALRGWKFSQKVFNFRQPKYLLYNYDLKILGPLIRTYISGPNTINEYEATGFLGGEGPVLAERFIRVTLDTASLAEISRKLVVRGPNSNSATAVQCQPFEVTKGDKIKFSFTMQTNVSQPGVVGIVFAVILQDGISTKYVDELPVGNGAWINSLGFSYNFPGGDNTNLQHNIEIASSQVPFSGLVYCYLASATQAPFNTSRETWYTDIRLEYQPYIADSTKITGQIHKQLQNINKKLNNDVEVFLDDTPRNSIEGTLFLTTKTPATAYGLQDRTFVWRYPNPPSGDRRLGELNTWEELQYKRVTRSKMEGSFVGNYQAGIPVSLLTMAIMSQYPNKNYTFGLLTIDYKKNQFSGTLFEIYDVTDADLVADYTLTYKYATQ